MPSKGVITWKGDLGNPDQNYSRSTLENVTDSTAWGTFMAAIAAHSDCNIAKHSYNAVTAGTDTPPGVAANVDKKGTIYMRNPTNLHLVKFSIPAPKAADVESIPGTKGERYTAVALAAIVGDINTACGTSYTALYGTVTQKS